MQVRRESQNTKIKTSLSWLLGTTIFGLNLRYFRRVDDMKKIQIIALVAIAAVIAYLMIFMKDLSTYDSIASARTKPGKYIHLIAKLDRTRPIEYDPVKNPNFLSFYAIDSLGSETKVIYRNAKPTELEHSDRVVLKGKMNGEVFECKEILLKCPSKYKDDPAQQQKSLQQSAEQSEASPAADKESKP